MPLLGCTSICIVEVSLECSYNVTYSKKRTYNFIDSDFSYKQMVLSWKRLNVQDKIVLNVLCLHHCSN